MFEIIKKTFIKYPLIVVAVVITAWAGYPYYLKWIDNPLSQTIKQNSTATEDTAPAKTELENIGLVYGTYGDSYGSLNTLFSGLAFAMLIMSLLMQREELQAQRKELEAQRKEIQESNKIAEGQREITKQQADLITQQIEIAKLQNFYTLFFKQLEILEADYNNLFPKDISMKTNVLEYIRSSYLGFIDFAMKQEKIEIMKIRSGLQRELIRVTQHINLDLEHSLFLKSLLQMFKFLKQSQDIKSLDINQPINNLLTRLDNDFILVLTWIAITDDDQQLQNYLDELSMLKTIPFYLSYDQFKFIKRFFTKKAFQE